MNKKYGEEVDSEETLKVERLMGKLKGKSVKRENESK